MIKDVLAEYHITGGYHSPFERMEFSDDHCWNEYDGSLGEVLTDLSTSALVPEGIASRRTLALLPPLVIRGVLDYKVSHPRSLAVLGLLKDAIRLGSDIYSSLPELPEQIRLFRQRVIEALGGDILRVNIVQPRDPVTWRATNPNKSMFTAARLTGLTNSSDVLFIALAHGGVAAGMDTYLRYCDFTNSRNSEFYVVRFSRNKLHDKDPRLTQVENKYLQGQAVRRKVVIFDEDISGGRTMEIAGDFFTHVFPDAGVIRVANIE